MNKSEIIVRIGGEGGDVTLYGVRTRIGWRFSRKVVDQTPWLMDEPSILHTSEEVGSLAEGLALLDQYPWHNLHPIEVHPEFREEVFAAAMDRINHEKHPNQHALPKWMELCEKFDVQEPALVDPCA